MHLFLCYAIIIVECYSLGKGKGDCGGGAIGGGREATVEQGKGDCAGVRWVRVKVGVRFYGFRSKVGVGGAGGAREEANMAGNVTENHVLGSLQGARV